VLLAGGRVRAPSLQLADWGRRRGAIVATPSQLHTEIDVDGRVIGLSRVGESVGRVPRVRQSPRRKTRRPCCTRTPSTTFTSCSTTSGTAARLSAVGYKPCCCLRAS